MQSHIQMYTVHILVDHYVCKYTSDLLSKALHCVVFDMHILLNPAELLRCIVLTVFVQIGVWASISCQRYLTRPLFKPGFYKIRSKMN